MQKGGLANRMLGPSIVSGWPQQKRAHIQIPTGGIKAGKARAAQPESGLQRESNPTAVPEANRLSRKMDSSFIGVRASRRFVRLFYSAVAFWHCGRPPYGCCGECMS